MLSGPKVHWTRNLTKIGLVSSPANLWDYDYSGLLVSEPHWRYRTGKILRWSGGGPFYVYRSKLTHSGKLVIPVVKNTIGGTYTILGVLPNSQGSQPSMPTPPTFATASAPLSAAYATAYKRARPGNPVASMGQFLIELRDLPRLPFRNAFLRPGKGLVGGRIPFRNKFYPVQDVPRILQRQLLNYRNLGSEYLNVVFGWKPFVSDLQKMYNLWQTIDARMAQLIRENGKYIRRKATLEDVETDVHTGTVYPFPYVNVLGAPPNYMTGTTAYNVTTRTKTKVWFSGSFRYYIPDVSSSLWNARARAALFGALPTPELLWEVLPWSWLIDWFSNVGDVISNASTNAVDNLTLRYSFIMKHVSTEVEATSFVYHPASTAPLDKWPQVQNTFVSKKLEETKLRRGGGNPFGLDVTLPSLSTYQLGILAALGLSRSRVR